MERKDKYYYENQKTPYELNELKVNENGRNYYECLKEQKNKQRLTVKACDKIEMPLDRSDYNTMFMTF